MENRNVRTIFIFIKLLEATDRAVREGKACSRNELVTLALRHELTAQKRGEIDVAFAAIADDAEYQAEVVTMSNEFATADWGALQIGESQP